MESYYSSLNRIRSSDHESYYRTPEYGPEDIICPGSDNEETPEETRRKRLRYEAQARRYMRGHRPVLLSASLRGPLSKESGWENPWLRPGTKRDQNRGLRRPPLISSQTESHSSKYFNRPTDIHGGQKERGAGRRIMQRETGSSSSRMAEKESTMKMGYANPTEVVAWQAKSIVVENIVDEEVYLNSEPTNGRMRVEQGTADLSLVHPMGEISDLYGAQQVDSMVNNYVKTPHPPNNSDFTRGIKRAGDSQWLKGSYVSKRARWDGPVQSSPTPAPESAAFKAREKRHASAGSAAQRKSHPGLPAADVQRSKSERPPRTPSVGPTMQSNSAFSAQVDNRMLLPSDTTGIELSSIRISSISEQRAEDSDMDELQEESQASWPVSRRSSGKLLSRSLNKALDRSSSDLGQDDLVAITPGPASSRSRNSSKKKVPLEFSSATLPKLRPQTGNNLNFCEDTFVSEVAPSSRDLEQFHFKKRKRRTKSSQYNTSGIENDQDVLPDITITEDPQRNGDGMPTETTSPRHLNTEMLVDVESIGAGEVPGDGVGLRHYPSDVEVAGVDSGRGDLQRPVYPNSHGNGEDMGDEENLGSVDILGDVEEADVDGQQTKAVACLEQSQINRTTFSEPKRLLLEDKTLPSVGDEGDGSWNLGDMSFLRAVLRAGGSTKNTPSNSRGIMPEPERSSTSLKEPQEASHHFEYLAKLNFSASGSTPVAPPRGQTPSSSPSQRPPHSEGPVGDYSHSSIPLSVSKISQLKPSENIFVSQVDTTSISPEEDEEHHSDHLPEPESSPPQQHIASSLPQAIHQKPTFSQKSEPSQDPNDFTTQSYNTTPFRSQRSVRPPRSARLPKVSEDQGLKELFPSNVLELAEGTNAMEMIQLELSQACHSSSQQSGVPHDDDEEADEEAHDAVGDAAKEIGVPGVEEEEMIHSTVIKDLATSEQAIDTSDASRESSDDAFDPKTALQEEQVSEEQPEQPRTKSPKIVLGEYSGHVDINTEANANNSCSEEASEASWEGCGPQSPWANETNKPILVHATTHKERAESPISPLSEREKSDTTEQKYPDDISSGWEHVERPQTPDTGVINQFRELVSPSESPKPELEEPIQVEALTNTQLLVEAATANPWASSMKKTKRVSFVELSLDNGEDSQESQPMRVRFGPASPPLRELLDQEDIHNNGTTTASKFENHFNRQYKRLLPPNVASLVGRSPALAAQAEAFIAADGDTSIEQEANTYLKTPTRVPKAGNEAESNATWKRQEGLDVLFPSLSNIVRTPSPVRASSLAGFDMAEALGDAGNFLEEWSVDSELKKAKGSETDKGARNGSRRKRLFGFV